MSNIAFAWPYAAFLLLLLIPMWFFEKKQKGRDSILWGPQALALKKLVKEKKLSLWSKGVNWWLLLVFSSLILALMRPQYVGEPMELSRDGRNIMLVLDISESMEANDMIIHGTHESRLVSAKKVMSDFIDQRHGDRIGLVVFGSETFLHSPLSFDYETVKQFLSEAEIGFAGPKTAIGDAIGLGVKKLLEQTPGDKTLILLTDGQNNMGSLEPLKAAEIAKKYHVKIYVVGIGSSRMVVDGFFGPTTINPSASLDEAEPELKEIASMTGGKYFRAKEFDTLSAIYQEIDRLEPVKADPIVIVPRKELFYWPLMLLCLFIALRAFMMLSFTSSGKEKKHVYAVRK